MNIADKSEHPREESISSVSRCNKVCLTQQAAALCLHRAHNYLTDFLTDRQPERRWDFLYQRPWKQRTAAQLDLTGHIRRPEVQTIQVIPKWNLNFRHTITRPNTFSHLFFPHSFFMCSSPALQKPPPALFMRSSSCLLRPVTMNPVTWSVRYILFLFIHPP